MTIVLAAALWFTLLIAPDTPIGRAIHHWLVAKPAARLNGITRGQMLLAILLITGASLAGWAIGHEAVRLMAMGLPELATWVTMFEVTAYLDALAAIVTAASVTRWAAVKAWVRSVVMPRRGYARPPRTRASSTRVAANDDDGRGRLSYAA